MYSAELIQEFKKAMECATDSKAAEMLPNLTKQNISHIKAGKRHLTEEQALFIAQKCGLSEELVLVNLAAETSRCEKAKAAWAELGKQISRSVTAAALIVALALSAVQQKDSPEASFS